jgi:hypothetical protein
MDKIIFVDFQTKITALWLNTVSDTVWGALGQASTPQEARQFIGAVEEAPSDGNAYLRAGGGWSRADTSLSHNALGGRSVSDAHPTSAITGLDSALAGKAPLASPAFTGNPTAPTPTVGDNDTSIATTAFVKTALDNQASSGMLPSNDQPLMNGSASAGVSETGSRSDHVHPTDTSRAPASAATASGTSFTPAGNVAASNVQAAIQELDGEKAPASAATAVGTSFTPTGAVGVTNVQAAIAELDSEKQPRLSDTVQVGDSTTATRNFTLDASADNGTMKLARGNAGATTQDVMTVDADGKVGFPQLTSLLVGGNGYAFLPNGILIQWGFNNTDATGICNEPFPISWPNGCMQMVAVGGTSSQLIVVNSFDVNGYLVFANAADGGAGITAGFRWIAVGY